MALEEEENESLEELLSRSSVAILAQCNRFTAGVTVAVVVVVVKECTARVQLVPAIVVAPDGYLKCIKD